MPTISHWGCQPHLGLPVGLTNTSSTGVLGGPRYPSVFNLRELQHPWCVSILISVGRKREPHRVMSC